MAALASAIPRDLYTWDLLGAAAAALIARGIWLIYRPAALIFLGLVCGAAYFKREWDMARRCR